jgi:DNA polymerase-3 subunit gamma/tau
MDGRHVDVIEMDAASHTGIDDIREIIEQVRYRPVSARYKVYIIDEVHMLSTQAFNGLLKTLEEPPEHVKFIFATTEIRKVPITVLSRCQRFDLRRISASRSGSASSPPFSAKEGVPASIRRRWRWWRGQRKARRATACRCSIRRSPMAAVQVEIETVRSHARPCRSGADRRPVRACHASGDVAGALDEFAAQYEAGANPTVVLTDLADFTHLVTRLKYVPDAVNDQSLSEIERTRGAEFAGSVAVTTLSRVWQMLLKGIPEAESSARPAGAAEMVLIRLAHAAHLPSPEEAARRLLDLSGGEGGGRPAPNGGGGGGGAQAPAGTPVEARAVETAVSRPSGNGATMLRAVPSSAPPQPISVGRIEERTVASAAAKPEPKVPVNSIGDIADLCAKNRDIKLKTMVRGFLRLVHIEPGRLDVNLPDDAPKTLLNELAVKLKEWTGIHWVVSYSREQGEPTLVEAEQRAQEQRVNDARQDPDVVAILARFPGARITDVRIRAAEEEVESLAPAAAESEDGDIVPGDDIE